MASGTQRLIRELAYSRDGTVTEIKAIPDCRHGLTIDHGWKEVAEAALMRSPPYHLMHLAAGRQPGAPGARAAPGRRSSARPARGSAGASPPPERAAPTA